MESRMHESPIDEYERAVLELKRAADELESKKQERHDGREIAVVGSRSTR